MERNSTRAARRGDSPPHAAWCMIGAMKFRRLPPLAVLHSFEVASSLLSFKDAAAVLHLTPSAISHQMRALEAFVGQPLFRRFNRRLELTEAGARYLADVRRALESLRDATDGLRRDAGVERLTMSVGTFVGTEFVLPRLADFQRAHPEIELRVIAEQAERDLLRGEADVAVRLAIKPPRGVHVTPLAAVAVVPVAAPGSEASMLRADADLLQIAQLPAAWAMWFEWAGIAHTAPRRGPTFDNYGALLSACERGLGVGLGMLPVVSGWLAGGRLMALHPAAMPTPFSYYSLCRAADAERPAVRAVTQWLQQQLAG